MPEPETFSPVTIALAGCGYWGPNLARNFHNLPETVLHTCCDLRSETLQHMETLYTGVRTTNDYTAMVQDPHIEAVALATPVRTHYALAKAALLAGKHVFVEKPLTMDSRQALELTTLAQERRQTLMVGHVFEYNPAVLKIKELLDSKEIGRVFYVYSNRVNLGRVQSDINALWSIAPHDISILLFLLEQMPISVSAQGATYLKADVEDVVFVTLHFPGGIVGHVQASWLDPSKVRRMTVVGSERMILYDDVASEGKVRIYDKGVYVKGEDIYGEFQYRLHSGDIHIPKIEMTEPLRNECAHFAHCIRTGERPRSDGRSGWRVVRVLEAAQESLRRKGALVRLGNT
ncbi:MAG: Gfo/Idh/MocA family oxidoreductase [Chloroflexi bacterium]|nr:Gfo/Idh/MocA family oxidoreductase [Chloroflexota bacterium]